MVTSAIRSASPPTVGPLRESLVLKVARNSASLPFGIFIISYFVNGGGPGPQRVSNFPTAGCREATTFVIFFISS